MFSSLHLCVGMTNVQPVVEEVGAARDVVQRKTTVAVVIGDNRICLLNAEPWQLEEIAQRLLVIAQDVRTQDYSGEVYAAVVDALPMQGTVVRHKCGVRGTIRYREMESDGCDVQLQDGRLIAYHSDWWSPVS